MAQGRALLFKYLFSFNYTNERNTHEPTSEAEHK